MRENFDFENDQLLQNYFKSGETPKQQDIIKWAKSYFSKKSPEQRLNAAIKHLFDALSYRSPRIDIESDDSPSTCSDILAVIYQFQTSSKWRNFLTILTYIFMYLILIDYMEPKQTQLYIECTILSIFWIDILLQTSHRYLSDKKYIGFESTRYNVKIIIILLITLDEVLSICHHEFRLLVILRAGLPLLWDTSLRRKMICVGRLYKDFLVYVFFFAVVVFFFAVAVNQFMKPIQQGQEYDKLTQEYGSVSQAMLLFYVMSSYDSYPDNQLFTIRNQPGIYAIFILFIFLNIIFFQVVPTSLLYKQFSNQYAKCILLDQIRQQHSLIFSFVALSDDQMMIPFSKFVSFMFAVYRNRSQYVGYITQISLHLNHHHSDCIHISEFMQLCKIIQSHQEMIPSDLPELQLWTTFREVVNHRFGLKQLALSTQFQIAVSALVLLSIVNCIFVFYNQTKVFNVIDKIFVIIFSLQMVIKIIGLGPYNFFKNFLNVFDFFVVILMIALEIFDTQGIPSHSAGLTNILRFHRVPLLGKLLASKFQLIQHSSLYIMWARLANHLIITFPAVFQFVPIFLIVSYFLGVAGMFIFRHPPSMPPQQSDYSKYDDFSNYRHLIYTQFYNVQILVQAGWSAVLFDHVYRYGYTFLLVMYFIVCHLVIVVVLTPLFRGITWAFYQTINNQSTSRVIEHIHQHLKIDKLKHQMKDLQNVEIAIKQNKPIQPISVSSRRVIQGKLSQLMIQKVKYELKKLNERSNFYQCNYVVDEIDKLNQDLRLISKKSSIKVSSLIQNLQIGGIQSLEQQDIDRQIQKMSTKILINPDLNIEQLQCPDILVRFLKRKLRIVSIDCRQPLQFNSQSSQHTQHILNQMRCMLKITNNFKKNLLKNLKQVLNQNQVNVNSLQISRKKDINSVVLNQNMILRKSFMRNCSEKLIKKVQLEYFSQIYPNHFRQMFQNVGLQSLLLQDSRVTYALRNILRYPTIEMDDFFNFLTSIEDTISSKLFKEGSLFKFMFQLQEKYWFYIEMKPMKELRVHFLRNHIWIFENNMKSNQIYYAQDIFNSNQSQSSTNNKFLHKKLKTLFQNFESIAINSQIRDYFFSVNPTEYSYDLYQIYKNVQKSGSSSKRKYKISKIMAFVLSKQRQRNQLLPYDLSKIESSTHWNPERPLNFKFDESQMDTYQKIRKMETTDDQIVKNEKRLSHPFAINLMTEIGDIIETGIYNFTMQVQNLLTIFLTN